MMTWKYSLRRVAWLLLKGRWGELIQAAIECKSEGGFWQIWEANPDQSWAEKLHSKYQMPSSFDHHSLSGTSPLSSPYQNLLKCSTLSTMWFTDYFRRSWLTHDHRLQYLQRRTTNHWHRDGITFNADWARWRKRVTDDGHQSRTHLRSND